MAIAGLYAITRETLDTARLLADVAAAIEGGARIVQYRDKSQDGARRHAQAAELKRLCAARGATFIINDDVSLAAEVAADGVHLGRDDGGIAGARARLGTGAIIGISCYNELPRALRAAEDGADYVAFGAFFPSGTKPAAVRADLALLRAARTALSLPIVVIGGITADNAGALIAAGADSIAVVGAVFDAADIHGAARRLSGLFPPAQFASPENCPNSPAA